MPSSRKIEDEKRRGAPPARPRGAKRPDERDQFVNLELSVSDKENLVSYCTTLDELDAALEGMISDGYKFTLRYDEFNKAVAFFAFPPEGDANAGYILSGRGRYPSRAIRQLVYKHHTMLEGDWAGAEQRRQADDSVDW